MALTRLAEYVRAHPGQGQHGWQGKAATRMAGGNRLPPVVQIPIGSPMSS